MKDSRYGRGWNKDDCSSMQRNADNTIMYDATNCSSEGDEIRACGQLISGIVWDLREALSVSHPNDFQNIVNSLTLNSILLHGPGLEIDSQIAIDFLSLDDDDGNLDNGTPHRAELCGAFAAHCIDRPLTNQTPCAGLCSNPLTFSWNGNYQSGALGTGTVCRETTQVPIGGDCGNFAAGRTLSVNGTIMTCNGQNSTQLPAARNGGYCISTTAGNYAWAFYTLF